MTEVAISAVICTRDRAAHLRTALESLSRQTLPRERYEIIVVDNGSTDGTEHVVRSFETEASILYLHEAEVGVSKARNRGWKAARGEYVTYLDDDAVASASWLEEALAAFTARDPAPGCVGGRVLPRWEQAPPSWLTDNLKHYLSVLDWTESAGVLAPDKWLLGGNCAYPRRLLDAVGGFREDLGRVGDRLLSMDENWVHRLIRARGHALVYVPAMTIHHHVPAGRLRRRWFLRRCFWQGVSRSTMDRGLRLARVLEMPSRPSPRPVFEQLCMFTEKVGVVYGRVRQVRERPA